MVIYRSANKICNPVQIKSSNTLHNITYEDVGLFLKIYKYGIRIIHFYT
jgi:hypothetical protein